MVDWRAGVWAGLLAGGVFFLFNIWLVPAIVGGNAWVMIRLFASIVLGPDVLAPPATCDLSALSAALAVNAVLAVLFGLLVAFVIHRGGLLAGVVGGALLGLAFYLINFYTFSLLFPWFFAFHGWPMALSHVLFGALAGGIYEVLGVQHRGPADA